MSGPPPYSSVTSGYPSASGPPPSYTSTAGGGYPGGPAPRYPGPSSAYPPSSSTIGSAPPGPSTSFGGSSAGAGGSSGSGSVSGGLDTSREMRPYTGRAERDRYELLATLFETIKVTEHLETVYTQDLVTDDEYQTECYKLLRNYATTTKALLKEGHLRSVDEFYREYGLRCQLARDRFEVGVPANVVHASHDPTAAGSVAAVKVTQCFITALDALRLGETRQSEVFLLVSELSRQLNRLSSLPRDFAAKTSTVHWVETLNSMRALDDLDEDQAAQLQRDLESSYNMFCEWIEERAHK